MAPGPRDVLYEARRRAQRVWYRVEDAAITVGRAPAWLGGHAKRLWLKLSPATRQRLTVLAGVLAAAAAIWFVAVPALPCQFPGGNRCPPADEADDLVPADALLYLHANVDPDTEQYEQAREVAARLPKIVQQLVAQLPGPSGAPVDYRREVAPWLGGEAALAVTGGGGERSGQVAMFEVGDDQGAEQFSRQLVGKDARTDDYRETRITTGGDLSTALVGDFLVAGPEGAVRRVIDVELGEERSLAASDPAREVADELPDDSLAEAFVSADGSEDLFRSGGPLGSLEAFVNTDATRGAGAALVATDNGIELESHSLLDAERLESSPGFFDAFAPFEPGLAEELSAGALAYLGIGNPEQSVRALLAQAAAEAPQLVSGFEQFTERVDEVGKLNLEREVLALLGGEAAIAIEPPAGAEDGGQGPGGAAEESEVPEGLAPGGPAPTGTPPGSLPFSGVPYLEFIAEEVEEEAARKALADLQVPVAGALDPDAGGQAPIFDEREIEGVEARSVRISPTVNLTYALIDGKLVIATDPAGIKQVKAGSESLEDSDGYEHATEGFPDELSALVFLNLTDLITLAEQAGLAADPAYALLAPEVRKLEALGLAVVRSEDGIESTARLTIG